MEIWWRHHIFTTRKDWREGANSTVNFGRCILLYYRMALYVFAKQHMQAQIEAICNLCILYDIYVLNL
jgi:hypothetical protein